MAIGSYKDREAARNGRRIPWLANPPEADGCDRDTGLQCIDRVECCGDRSAVPDPKGHFATALSVRSDGDRELASAVGNLLEFGGGLVHELKNGADGVPACYRECDVSGSVVLAGVAGLLKRELL